MLGKYLQCSSLNVSDALIIQYHNNHNAFSLETVLLLILYGKLFFEIKFMLILTPFRGPPTPLNIEYVVFSSISDCCPLFLCCSSLMHQ